ncbi:class I SAM-dependent methyltransferase [Salinimicrobium sp. GXAS 041]|uniref:class I SAM-dependent methyltransferase n=1 Tax=Salinimicrobium sp. GXAS 041 TaxID=3400806 RepID=UPI003C78DCF8
MKDNFSTRSNDYAKFRPGYPQEMFHFLSRQLSAKERAWDCGTGNGQVAGKLADFFREVYGTDISVNQLMNAQNKPNIHYSKQKAEKTNFPDAFFDLVTVAQAVHWFDFNEFYSEVQRTLKPGGIIAIMGYGLFSANEATNKVIDHFYREIVGPFWDEERKYLDEEYKTIPFPFEEVETPEFRNEINWSLERLVGYLKTWSAVKHYEKEKHENPVDLVYDELKEAFGEHGKISFPVLFRMGRKN